MLRLTDTRTRQVEDIVPASAGALSVYACGPTVYRDAHVGNLRTFLLTDLIRRIGEYHGLRVTVAQNITDVGHMADDRGLAEGGEDKLLSQSRAENRSALDVARHYETAYFTDLDRLGIRPADIAPRASESIDLMINLIGQLIDKGHAYVGGDGSVYFDAQSISDYGALSGNRLDQLRPGHRFTVEEDPEASGRKRFHADWALWKSAGTTRTQLVWETPWGLGFPGWHIECSAMSLHHLGPTIDIHTGGIDLRFPHHEDEKAQSDAVVGHEVVRHWVHAEHLLFDGRKMAKSTGNVVLVSDVIDRGFDPLALRLCFLEHHYRQQMNLTWEAIGAAQLTLDRWRSKVAAWAEEPSAPMDDPTRHEVVAAFDDDLDTPRAIRALRRLERDESVPAGSRFETFAHLDRLLGIDLARNVGRPPVVVDLPAGAQELLAARDAARAAKQWSDSDRLRDELAALGVTVTDTKDGQQWSM
ncbi:MAG TPA: cysteine--tRNA ligase [Actinobacteria bacterium]|nr:cysteine--tRNA ligase [Actinomycetota bacterium]